MGPVEESPSLVLGVIVATGAVLLWLGAEVGALLASGKPVTASGSVVLRSVFVALAHPDNPARAWPSRFAAQLPGPVGYWASSAAVCGVGGTAAVFAAGFLRRITGEKRRRFGVEASARLARPGDLRPLMIKRATPGRFELGRVGRHRIATEDIDSSPRSGLRPVLRQRRPTHRTSVAMIGPTRCGKTAAAIGGILDWSGPAILSSVKSDLMGATIRWRRSLGEVRVFDPTTLTTEPTCGWSPLRGATTVTGAQKAARALVDAGPRRGIQDLDFFLRLAEQLLWPHLYFAASSGRTTREVIQWLLTQRSPHDEDSDLTQTIELALLDPDPNRREDARHAHDALTSIWGFDHRTRSNAYATVQTLIGAWTDPGVLAASEVEEIDLEWLLAGSNTLYICSPLHEQQRLAPVFGSLLGDLINQAYERVASNDEPLPTTLMVLDEAANTPTRWLPQVASTCAGIGLLLVTIWQSKAQLDAAYGDMADSVLTNHGTKIIFSGASDLSTLEYAARLVGDEEIVRRATTLDQRDGHRTVNLSRQAVPLLPGHVLRQTRPGNALLVHAALPPAHLKTRPYYRDRALRAKANALR
jgi:type IV secretion system protein VirD4